MNQIYLLITAFIVSACTVDAEFSGTATEEFLSKTRVSKLRISGDDAATPSNCSDTLSVELLNSSDDTVEAYTNLRIQLTTDQTGIFYSDASCSTVISSLEIETGNSSASFYYAGSTMGAHTLTASYNDLSDGSFSFTVANPGAYRLAFLTSINNTESMQPIGGGFLVEVRDADGNQVAESGHSISISIETNPASGTLAGTTLVTSDTNGQAYFGDLTINAASAGYTLSASATGLLSDSSSAFEIFPGAASYMTFSGQPNSSYLSTETIQVAVSVFDGQNNLLTNNSTDSISISFATNPGGSASITPIENLVAGVATFTGISVTAVANGYSLNANWNGTPTITNIVSSTFDINPGLPTQAIFATNPSSVVEAGSTFTTVPVVHLLDTHGNLTNSGALVTLSLYTDSGCTAGGTTSSLSNFQVNAVNGVANFSSIFATETGTFYFGADATSVAGKDCSTPFLVNPGIPTQLEITGPSIGTFNTCQTSPFTVQTLDQYGNVAPTTSDQFITFGSTPGNFYPGNTCAGTISTVTISSGTSSASFYYQGYQTGSVTINVESSPLTADSMLYNLYIDAKPVYSNAPDWNDYVRNTNPNEPGWGQAAPPICTGGETGNATACLHAGELKKVEIPIYATGTECSQWSITESQNWMNWKCVDSGVTYVTFYSRGLKRQTRLAHLIDMASSVWQSNGVSASNGTTTFTSLSKAWWNNTIEATTLSASTPTVLSTPGTVYFVSSSQTGAGFNINADRVSLVVDESVKLSLGNSIGPNCDEFTGVSAGSQRCLISIGKASGQRSFIWLEGNFYGGDTNPGVVYTVFARANFSKFRNVSVHGGNSIGFRTYSSTSNYFSNVTVVDSIKGIQMFGSNGNVLNAVRSGNHTGFGLYLSGSDRNLVINSIFSGNMGVGAHVTNNSSENRFINITSANNSLNGIELSDNYGEGNAFINLFSVNNGQSGLELYRVLPSTSFSTFINIALMDNGSGTSGDTGISIQNASYNRFQGSFVNDNNYAAGEGNCYVAGLNTGLADITCTNSGSDGSFSYPSPGPSIGSDAVYRPIPEDNSSTFATPTVTSPYTGNDFFTYPDIYSMWGLSNFLGFPLSTQRGACLSGTCSLWDWKLVSTDQTARRRTFDGSGPSSIENPDFVNGSPCPYHLDGSSLAVSRAFLSGGANTNYFLKHAYERVSDFYGNDDGLCEDGEVCIYAPNYGAYQGGEISEQCTYPGSGLVNNVTILASPDSQNGI